MVKEISIECSVCSGAQTVFCKWHCRRNTQRGHHELMKIVCKRVQSTGSEQYELSALSI